MVDREQESANLKSGAEIRKWRKAAGISQEQLSFAANLDQSTLSKVERIGPQVVSWQKLFAIADALGCVVAVTLTPRAEN